MHSIGSDQRSQEGALTTSTRLMPEKLKKPIVILGELCTHRIGHLIYGPSEDAVKEIAIALKILQDRPPVSGYVNRVVGNRRCVIVALKDSRYAKDLRAFGLWRKTYSEERQLLGGTEAVIGIDIDTTKTHPGGLPSTIGHELFHHFSGEHNQKRGGTVKIETPLPTINDQERWKLLRAWKKDRHHYFHSRNQPPPAGTRIFEGLSYYLIEYELALSESVWACEQLLSSNSLLLWNNKSIIKQAEAQLENAWAHLGSEIPTYMLDAQMEFGGYQVQQVAPRTCRVLNKLYGIPFFGGATGDLTQTRYGTPEPSPLEIILQKIFFLGLKVQAPSTNQPAPASPEQSSALYKLTAEAEAESSDKPTAEVVTSPLSSWESNTPARQLPPPLPPPPYQPTPLFEIVPTPQPHVPTLSTPLSATSIRIQPPGGGSIAIDITAGTAAGIGGCVSINLLEIGKTAAVIGKITTSVGELACICAPYVLPLAFFTFVGLQIKRTVNRHHASDRAKNRLTHRQGDRNTTIEKFKGWTPLIESPIGSLTPDATKELEGGVEFIRKKMLRIEKSVQETAKDKKLDQSDKIGTIRDMISLHRKIGMKKAAIALRLELEQFFNDNKKLTLQQLTAKLSQEKGRLTDIQRDLLIQLAATAAVNVAQQMGFIDSQTALDGLSPLIELFPSDATLNTLSVGLQQQLAAEESFKKCADHPSLDLNSSVAGLKGYLESLYPSKGVLNISESPSHKPINSIHAIGIDKNTAKDLESNVKGREGLNPRIENINSQSLEQTDTTELDNLISFCNNVLEKRWAGRFKHGKLDIEALPSTHPTQAAIKKRIGDTVFYRKLKNKDFLELYALRNEAAQADHQSNPDVKQAMLLHHLKSTLKLEMETDAPTFYEHLQLFATTYQDPEAIRLVAQLDNRHAIAQLFTGTAQLTDADELKELLQKVQERFPTAGVSALCDQMQEIVTLEQERVFQQEQTAIALEKERALEQMRAPFLAFRQGELSLEELEDYCHAFGEEHPLHAPVQALLAAAQRHVDGLFALLHNSFIAHASSKQVVDAESTRKQLKELYNASPTRAERLYSEWIDRFLLFKDPKLVTTLSAHWQCDSQQSALCRRYHEVRKPFIDYLTDQITFTQLTAKFKRGYDWLSEGEQQAVKALYLDIYEPHIHRFTQGSEAFLSELFSRSGIVQDLIHSPTYLPGLRQHREADLAGSQRLRLLQGVLRLLQTTHHFDPMLLPGIVLLARDRHPVQQEALSKLISGKSNFTPQLLVELWNGSEPREQKHLVALLKAIEALLDLRHLPGFNQHRMVESGIGLFSTASQLYTFSSSVEQDPLTLVGMALDPFLSLAEKGYRKVTGEAIESRLYHTIKQQIPLFSNLAVHAVMAWQKENLDSINVSLDYLKGLQLAFVGANGAYGLSKTKHYIHQAVLLNLHKALKRGDLKTAQEKLQNLRRNAGQMRADDLDVLFQLEASFFYQKAVNATTEMLKYLHYHRLLQTTDERMSVESSSMIDQRGISPITICQRGLALLFVRTYPEYRDRFQKEFDYLLNHCSDSLVRNRLLTTLSTQNNLPLAAACHLRLTRAQEMAYVAPHKQLEAAASTQPSPSPSEEEKQEFREDGAIEFMQRLDSELFRWSVEFAQGELTAGELKNRLETKSVINLLMEGDKDLKNTWELYHKGWMTFLCTWADNADATAPPSFSGLDASRACGFELPHGFFILKLLGVGVTLAQEQALNDVLELFNYSKRESHDKSLILFGLTAQKTLWLGSDKMPLQRPFCQLMRSLIGSREVDAQLLNAFKNSSVKDNTLEESEIRSLLALGALPEQIYSEWARVDSPPRPDLYLLHHIALHRNNSTLIDLFKAYGADFQVTDYFNMNALEVLLSEVSEKDYEKSFNSIEALIRGGIDPNTASASSWNQFNGIELNVIIPFTLSYHLAEAFSFASGLAVESCLGLKSNPGRRQFVGMNALTIAKYRGISLPSQKP